MDGTGVGVVLLPECSVLISEFKFSNVLLDFPPKEFSLILQTLWGERMSNWGV